MHSYIQKEATVSLYGYEALFCALIKHYLLIKVQLLNAVSITQVQCVQNARYARAIKDLLFFSQWNILTELLGIVFMLKDLKYLFQKLYLCICVYCVYMHTQKQAESKTDRTKPKFKKLLITWHCKISSQITLHLQHWDRVKILKYKLFLVLFV